MSFSSVKSFLDDYADKHTDYLLNKKANKWSTEIATKGFGDILDTKQENEEWRSEWANGGDSIKIKVLSGKILFQASMLRDIRNQYFTNVDGDDSGTDSPRTQESMNRHTAESTLFMKYILEAWKKSTEDV